MPKKIYATSEFVDTLEVPRPGENVDSGDVNSPFQQLLNNDKYLRGQNSEILRRLDALTLLLSSFTVSLPPLLKIEPSRTYTLTDAVGVSRVNGYSGEIDLQALDVPAGITVTFNPDPVGSGDRATMTVAAGEQLVPGLYTVTVRAVATDGRIAEAKMKFDVAAQTQQSTFTVEAPPNSSIDRATEQTKVTVPINVRRSGLFADPINFTITNLPAGLTAAWSKNPVTGNTAVEAAATTLTLTAAASLPTGTYALSIRATSGSIVRTLPLALAVTAPVAAGGVADLTAEFVYDDGDPAVTNGGTLYINRLGGFTGPVKVSTVQGNVAIDDNTFIPGPVVLIDGQPLQATTRSNTVRVTAEGASTGWTGSGVANVRDRTKTGWPYTSSDRGPHADAPLIVEGVIDGQTVTRYARYFVRVGTRTY